MYKFFLVGYRWLMQFGIDLRQFTRAVRGLYPFYKDYFKLKRQKDNNWPVSIAQPCLGDRFDNAGSIDRQYFYQDTYVARKIYEAAPEDHIDIGSRIDGFIAQLSVFRKVKVLDIRPLTMPIQNVSFLQANICDENFEMEKAASVSCLHTIEHFGLGRYGDPIGLDLWKLGLSNVWKIVAPDGKLYLATPIGRQRIVYNAHRVFMPSTVLKQLEDCIVTDFAYVDDQGNFSVGSSLDVNAMDSIASCFDYGLGIFTLQKSI
jgi:hypothetical protein